MTRRSPEQTWPSLCEMDAAWCDRIGFERLVMTDVELGMAQSPCQGAPMMLVRGGEERDLAAIRASPCHSGMAAFRVCPSTGHDPVGTTVHSGGDGLLAWVDHDALTTLWTRGAFVVQRYQLIARRPLASGTVSSVGFLLLRRARGARVRGPLPGPPADADQGLGAASAAISSVVHAGSSSAISVC